MKSYAELLAERERIDAELVEAKKREKADALKTVRQLCKEFGFTADMLKGALAKGRTTKSK